VTVVMVMECLPLCREATAESAEDVAALVLRVERERQTDPTVVNANGRVQNRGSSGSVGGVALSSPPPPLSLLWSTAVWELAVLGVLWLWLLPSY